MEKVKIIGKGRVGTITAQIISEMELCREIALLDVREDLPEGIALDIHQTAPLFEFDTQVIGSNDPAIMSGSDVLVISAGISLKPGMSRNDLLAANLKVVDGICDNAVKFAPDAIMILVTNPTELLTYRAAQRTGWGRQRVFGLAGVLDGARMAAFIAMETGFSTRDISTLVLGGQGEQMVPLPRFCTINGIPVDHFIGPDQLEQIIERTRAGGAEITALRKNSSASEAPAAAVAAMIDAISNNRRQILSCMALLHGEYDADDIVMGVPCIINENGVESIVQLALNEQELRQFRHATNAFREERKRLVELTA